MDNFLKTYDILQIKSDEKVEALTDANKVQIVDYLTKSTAPGLKVTFELSASGKVINGRIYTPWGQEAGKDSWVQPYPKPILKEHKKTDDPLGRITQVDFVSQEKEAITHLGDVRKYLEVKKAFDSKNNKAINQVMTKYNLYKDKKWPGLTKLVATARISDSDAIQKFLDQRYLTFSSGAETDSYTCLVCDSEWHKGNICDHRPGKEDEEGNTAYFITGMYYGDEASIVNNPANKTSMVKSLEFETETMKDYNSQDFTNYLVSEAGVEMIMTDSITELPDQKRILAEEYSLLDAKTLIDLVGTEAFKLQEILDAIDGSTLTEKEWIRRFNDELHASTDWRLPNDAIAKDVFAVHAKLHQIADALGFRDSFANGPLDEYDAQGVYVESDESSGNDTVETPDSKEPESEVVKPIVEVRDGQKEEEIQVEDKKLIEEPTKIEDVEIVLDDDIDWFTLDLALSALVPDDAKLSTEQREKLDASAFCGPERSFPVPDCKHYTAALSLLGRYKGPGNKDKIRACIESKGKKLGCVSESKDSKDCECDKQYKTLQQDYVQALRQIEDLQAAIRKVVTDRLGDNVIEDLVTMELTTLLDTAFEKIISLDNKKTGQNSSGTFNIKEVKDPSLATGGSEDNQKLKTLGAFEQEVVKKYRKLLEDKGREQADNWLRTKHQYLPRSFDPNKYI